MIGVNGWCSANQRERLRHGRGRHERRCSGTGSRSRIIGRLLAVSTLLGDQARAPTDSQRDGERGEHEQPERGEPLERARSSAGTR